jgi:hypothetical protein
MRKDYIANDVEHGGCGLGDWVLYLAPIYPTMFALRRGAEETP